MRNPIPDKKPWHQQEGEPDKWYALFTEYMNIGPGRNVTRLAEKYLDTPTSSAYRKKAAEWKWLERATAFDLEVANATVKAKEDILEQLKTANQNVALNIANAANRIFDCKSEEEMTENRYTLAKLEFIAGKGTVGSTIANLHKAIVGQKSDVVVTGKQVTIEFKEMEKE